MERYWLLQDIVNNFLSIVKYYTRGFKDKDTQTEKEEGKKSRDDLFKGFKNLTDRMRNGRGKNEKK